MCFSVTLRYICRKSIKSIFRNKIKLQKKKKSKWVIFSKEINFLFQEMRF